MMPKILKPTLQLVIFTILISAIQLSCRKKEPSLDEQLAGLSLEPLPALDHPSDNPTSAAKVELGRVLFWDPIVSGEKDVACATCHHPDLGYGDGVALPVGVRGNGLGPDRTEGTGIDRVPRNAPSILNTAFNGVTSGSAYDASESPMFWDSRMTSLESQCQGPPTSRSEMAGDAYATDMALDSIMLRLKDIPAYVTLFDAAFSGGASSITVENYAKAVAAFERTIISTNSPYDQYLAGNTDALTDEEKLGASLFFGEAKCGDCHSGPMLSDWNHYALGVAENPDRVSATPDSGKARSFAFRTPTLRNIELTAPYMHNGMQHTLEEVMEFYVNGVSENSHVSTVSGKFVNLELSDEEVAAIIAYMKALTDEDFDKTIPTSVPSGLTPGGSI